MNPVSEDGVPRLQGLPPVVSPDTRLLILGSFPGRASLVAFFILTDVTGFFFLSREGLVTGESALLALAFLPALAAGVWLGARIFTRADPARFRQIVLLILGCLALMTAVKAAMALNA